MARRRRGRARRETGRVRRDVVDDEVDHHRVLARQVPRVVPRPESGVDLGVVHGVEARIGSVERGEEQQYVHPGEEPFQRPQYLVQPRQAAPEPLRIRDQLHVLAGVSLPHANHASLWAAQPVRPARTCAVPDRPSRVAPAAIISSAVSVERMPPDALTPRRPPTVFAMRSTTWALAPPAGWKPVDVLTKSAPAASAAWHTATICSSVSTADSMMTLRTRSAGTAPRTAAMSACTAA